MALSDAILEIANLIVEDQKANEGVQQINGQCFNILLAGYIRQLRSAVKAAEGQQQSIVFNPFEKRAEDAAAKRALREVEDRINLQERQGTTMVNCIGGISDDVMTEIESRMPTDGTAKMIVTGQVYVRQSDGNLHYSEEETNKIRSKQ